MLGEEEANIFKPVKITSLTQKNSLPPSVIQGHTKYTHEDKGQSCSITYTFTADISGEAFFFMPSDYNRRISITANNKSYGTNENSRMISIGFYEAGETVNVTVKLENDVLYAKNNVDVIYMLDFSAFKEAIAKLDDTQMSVSEEWSDDYLPGSITTTKNDQLILTSIPYDEGWQITVDGQEVELTKALDALIAFEIKDAGEHRIVMKYRPTAFTLGLTISLGSLLLFVLIIIFDKQIRAILSKIAAQNDAISARLPEYDGDIFELNGEDKENKSDEANGANEQKTADGEKD
jgi:uncharacterized membrane protein YfhO